ncbi:putative disease resistance protein RGA4 [Salvia hispanica]|uniref:putative disease resistance protein RGA4 n=1 Tax=Salvia hispanica TaxID=49212 RepID=UPI00200971CE|nr:putative disease resistance protein RGA4 [Salvia hispanica]
MQALPNSLCTLWNLQILNLDDCVRLEALPKKLTSLRNLRHLCLWGCKSLREMPSKMRELNGLKTLSMFVVGHKRGNQLEELECLNISGRLQIRHLERVKDHMDAKKAKIAEKNNLRNLRLSWERNALSKLVEEVDERVLEALEPHPNLERLYIQGFSGRYLPRWMENSTQRKIVEINITDCENIRHFPKLGELPHLENLFLTNMGVEYIIEEEEVGSGHPGLSKEQQSSKEAFPNLECLSIKRCSSFVFPSISSLEKLKYLGCRSSDLALLSEHDIPSKLSIEVEENLTCFPIEALKKFSKLRSLTIENAKEISLTREVTLDLPKITRLPQAFQHLTFLCLADLPNLESLPDQPPSLSSLDVTSCPKVVSISDLPNLKVLSVIGCPQLERRLESFFKIKKMYQKQHWRKITRMMFRTLPEEVDVELATEMNDLGLPLSFRANKDLLPLASVTRKGKSSCEKEKTAKSY